MTSHCTQKAFTSEHKPQALFVVHSAERAGHGYDWSRCRRWINWSRCRRWISLAMIIVSNIMFFTAGFIAAFTAAFIVAFIVAPEF